MIRRLSILAVILLGAASAARGQAGNQTMPPWGLGYPAVTITQSGTPGTTEYAYMVVGTDPNGGTRVVSSSTALGNATINGSNFNIVTIAAWPTTAPFIAPTGSCNVYRMQTGTPATTGLIGTIASCSAGGSLNDTGLAGDSSLPPIDTTSLNIVTANVTTINEFSNPAALTAVAPVANYQYFNKINKSQQITNIPNAIGEFHYFQAAGPGQPNHSYGRYDVANFLNLNSASGIGYENDSYFADSTATNATNVSANFTNAAILGGATNYTSSVSSFSGEVTGFGTGAMNVATNFLSLAPLLFNGQTITNYGGFVALDQLDKASSLSAGFLAFNQTRASGHAYGFWSAATNRDQMGILTATTVTSNGTACANGNFAFSAGWGSTAAATGAAGTANTCQITITASGTGQAANPTVTWTLPNALPNATTVCSADQHGGTGASVFLNQTSLSSTAPIFTLGGTPVVNLTYIYVYRCGP